MAGIVETKQMVGALIAGGALILREVKRGSDAKTAVTNVVAEIMKDPALLQKMKDAIDGASAIPSEIKDLDAVEGFELAKEAVEDLAAAALVVQS